MSIYTYKWYLLNCSCPPFQNYFAASECHFADPSKYYNGVREKKHNVKGFAFLREWGSWVSSHLGWYKLLAIYCHENDDTEE